MQQLKEVLEEMLGEGLYQAVMSNSRDRERIAKVKVRPVMVKGRLVFQETAYIGTQVFHRNCGKEEMVCRIMEYMEKDFRQCEIETVGGRATALVSKKGRVSVKRKKFGENGNRRDMERGAEGFHLSHNRVKRYILEEDRPVPFLIDLGVQTKDGKIVRARYDKFNLNYSRNNGINC